MSQPSISSSSSSSSSAEQHPHLLQPPVRAEYEQALLPLTDVVPALPLPWWLRIWGLAAVRRLVILGVLAALWQGLAEWQDNDLLLPSFTATAQALVDGWASGELLRKSVVSVSVLLQGYALGIVAALVLTTGMKQRVAIARALAMQPRVLLMDEPFAALDALTRRLMQEELLALWEELRFTLVFVTHSIEEALVVGNRIAILSPHPGRVRAEVNSHQFDLSSQGSEAFQATAQRIHRLLFETPAQVASHDALEEPVEEAVLPALAGEPLP